MSNQSTNQPLVSVCIVTYNSADFIVEALDSVAAQTYKNIELIVSDDCSKDNTVEICQEWLTRNKDRFVNTELLTVEKNTGVSANCNRAIRKGRGEFVKYFAGDDKLLPNCIEDNLLFFKEHPETDFLFSDMQIIDGRQIEKYIKSPSVYFYHLSKLEFKLWQLVYYILPAPSNFMKREVYNELGGFDETIPMMEDKPFWVKAIFANRSICYLPKITVQYRINPNSLSQTKNSPNYYKLLESQKIASKFFLSKMKEISWWLWLYGKSIYASESLNIFKNRLLFFMRFFNVFYYYFRFMDFKIKKYSLMNNSNN